MEIDVRVDVKQATKYLSRVQRRVIPIATAKALTFTAERAQKAVTALIPQVFSKPTPFVRRSIRFIPASVRKLQSSVYIPNPSVEKVLLVQSDLRTTARRPKKATEIKLLGSYWVIGKQARKNVFGNLTRATYRKILSDVRNGPTTKRGYFMIGEKPRRLIMKRVSRIRSVPWLVEVDRPPVYGRRLPMNRVTQRTVKTQFPRLFDKAVARELGRVKV